MFRVRTQAYKSLQHAIHTAPRVGGLSGRARLANASPAATLHVSARSLYPRKSESPEEAGFSQAEIQQMIDGDDIIPEEDILHFDVGKEATDTAQHPHENSLFNLFYEYVEEPEDPSHPPSPLPSGLDPRQLPVQIESLADLGEDFTEEAYASALVHGRSIHHPIYHARTHSIPAATVTFYSHHPRLLSLFTHFAGHAASSLGIPISKVVMLPTERNMWTVLRSPFAHKKSQENFERRTHKRMIKAWDADPEVVDRWVAYLEKHSLGGVGIRVNKWERLPLGIGKTRLARVKDAFKVHAPEGVSAADVKLLELHEEVDSDASRKQAIQALGEKIVREETSEAKGKSSKEVKTSASDVAPSETKSTSKASKSASADAAKAASKADAPARKPKGSETSAKPASAPEVPSSSPSTPRAKASEQATPEPATSKSAKPAQSAPVTEGRESAGPAAAAQDKVLKDTKEVKEKQVAKEKKGKAKQGDGSEGKV